VLVRDFLKAAKTRGKRGVVVNLGCGRLVRPLLYSHKFPRIPVEVLGETGRSKRLDILTHD
jgi:hypothetical protein